MLQFTPHMNNGDVTAERTATVTESSPSSSSSSKVNEEKNLIQSKIMEVVNAAANNQRQIYNQKIHQLK